MRVDPVRDAISSYDLGEITLATLCSHTSLQIFHGAREEGFKTLGLAIGTIPKYYDAYPKAKPDDFLIVDSHLDVLKHAAELRDRNAILIPHGSSTSAPTTSWTSTCRPTEIVACYNGSQIGRKAENGSKAPACQCRAWCVIRETSSHPSS